LIVRTPTSGGIPYARGRIHYEPAVVKVMGLGWNTLEQTILDMLPIECIQVITGLAESKTIKGKEKIGSRRDSPLLA